MSQFPFGTAQQSVLLQLVSARNATWSRTDGAPLYESRALTDILCQGLVRHGYLDEELKGTVPVYTVTQAGYRKARELEHGIGNSL